MTAKDIKLNDDINIVMTFIYLYYVKMHKNIKLDYLFDLLKDNDHKFTIERLNFALKRISEEKFVVFKKCISDGEMGGILNWFIKEITIAGINYIEGIKTDRQKRDIVINIELVLSKITLN